MVDHKTYILCEGTSCFGLICKSPPPLRSLGHRPNGFAQAGSCTLTPWSYFAAGGVFVPWLCMVVFDASPLCFEGSLVCRDDIYIYIYIYIYTRKGAPGLSGTHAPPWGRPGLGAPQTAHSGPKIAPRGPQDAPRRLQDPSSRPKILLNPPKRPQSRPQEAPRCLQEASRGLKDASTRLQEGPRCLQKVPSRLREPRSTSPNSDFPCVFAHSAQNMQIHKKS